MRPNTIILGLQSAYHWHSKSHFSQCWSHINNSEGCERTEFPWSSKSKMTVHDFVIPKAVYLQRIPKEMTSLRQLWMHWVENTQYCTVHGGKTQRREQVLMGQHWLTHLRQETKRCLQASIKKRKEQGTVSTYFRGGGWDFCFYWLFLNRKSVGFSAALMCKELQGINSRQAFTLMIARLAFPRIRLYSTIDSSVSARCCVTIYDSSACVSLTSGWQNVILSRPFSVVWDQACQHAVKWTLFETVHSLILTQEMSWHLNLIFVFRSQREKTFISHLTNFVHFFFLVHSLPFSKWNSWLVYFLYKNVPFQNSYQWPHSCITYLHFQNHYSVWMPAQYTR